MALYSVRMIEKRDIFVEYIVEATSRAAARELALDGQAVLENDYDDGYEVMERAIMHAPREIRRKTGRKRRS